MGMIVISVLFLIGILFFIYWIPKKLGYAKVGKYLVIILAIILFLVVLFGIYQGAFKGN